MLRCCHEQTLLLNFNHLWFSVSSLCLQRSFFMNLTPKKEKPELLEWFLKLKKNWWSPQPFRFYHPRLQKEMNNILVWHLCPFLDERRIERRRFSSSVGLKSGFNLRNSLTHFFSISSDLQVFRPNQIDGKRISLVSSKIKILGVRHHPGEIKKILSHVLST